MKQTILCCLYVLSAVLVSCANENQSSPSIKKDYQEKYDFVMATLSATSREASVGTAEADLIISKITELKNIIPLSGLTENFTLDNLKTLSWDFTGHPAIRLKRLSSWVICHSPRSLDYANLKVESYTSPDYVTSVAPRVSSAYVAPGSTFDYDNSKAQYATKLTETVLHPGIVTVEFGISSSEPCSGPRNILAFTGYSDATLGAIGKWTEALDSVLAEVQVLKSGRSGNYPDSYILEKATKKLRAAFSALP